MRAIQWILSGILLLAPVSLVGCDDGVNDGVNDTPDVTEERIDETGTDEIGEEVEDTAG